MREGAGTSTAKVFQGLADVYKRLCKLCVRGMVEVQAFIWLGGRNQNHL